MPNGSPYWQGKADVRQQVALARIVETGLPMVYVNQNGAQDELVFDGGSFGLHGDRTLAFQMPQFEEAIEIVTWKKADGVWRCVDGPKVGLPDLEEANWRACVMGLRDYVNKNGFPGVVLGLSGGIDSAVVAAMAVDALGAERVHCVMLPYRYTSNESLSDAAGSPRRWGCATTSCRSSSRSRASPRRCRTCSPAGRLTSPRRTSSRAPAAPS